MNLGQVPTGSNATVATITGSFALWKSGFARPVLNLNNYTLNVTLDAYFSDADVTTNVDHDNPNGVRMGNITVGQTATFTETNTLTQGATGTAKASSLSLLTAETLDGDFNIFVHSDGVAKATANNTITLSHD